MSKTATIRAQQRWEYMSISRKTDTYLAGELNNLGQEGWEMVTINYARGKKEEMFWTAFLKRPATGQAAPATGREATQAQQEQAATPAKSFESLKGFDMDGDTFTIHEEEEKQEEPEPE
jgi:hypothetical protein